MPPISIDAWPTIDFHTTQSPIQTTYDDAPLQAGRNPWRCKNACQPTTDTLLAPDGRLRSLYYPFSRKLCHNWVGFSKRARSLKPFISFVLLEFEAVDILGPLTKSQQGFQDILMIAHPFTKTVQVIPLNLVRPVDVIQIFLEVWVYKC